MSPKLGRNQPCWCGSGKKYKNCHMREDEGKRQPPAAPMAPVSAPMQDEVVSDEVVSAERAAADAEWERFKAADLDGKGALFLEQVESKRLDAEDAFEMLHAIRDELDVRADAAARARFAELVERLRRELPDVYRRDRAFYLWDLMDDAVADRRWEALPALLSEFAEVADSNIDEFFRIVDPLLYHGQTEPLSNAMNAAWERVSRARGILPSGIDEFAGVLIRLAVFHYLETTPSPRADDPALKEALSPYPYDEAFVERAVRHLSAPAPSSWRVEDFGEEVDAEQWENNVIALLWEFVAERRRHAGVPFSKGDMARGQLQSVLLQQFAEPEDPSRAHRSPLVPRYGQVDRNLVSHFDMLGSQPYQAGALMELLPVYLHFLAQRGLVHPMTMDQALATLRPLSSQVRTVLDRFGVDTVLVQAVEAAWSEAALNALRQDPPLSAARAQPIVAAPVKSSPLPQTMTFKVVYQWKPEAWFVVEMRGDQTLDDLHHAILDAAGFDEDHMYSFFLSGRAWDDKTEYARSRSRHSSRVKLHSLRLRLKQRFLYLYDYGDEHRFDVQLIAASTEPPQGTYPKILERHGKMPPQYRDWDEEEDDEEYEEDEEEDE